MEIVSFGLGILRLGENDVIKVNYADWCRLKYSILN